MNLKEIRKSKKMSQRELAERSGVSMVTIARIETNTQEATESTIHKLKKALGCTYDDLLEKNRCDF